MDGGILTIDNVEKFNDEYVSDIRSNKKRCYVEKRTPIFKFFIDYDYVDETPLPSESLLKFVKECMKYTQGSCYISRTPPRTVKNGIKSGVHLHWPEMLVDSEQAMNIIKNLVSPHIDPSVYNGSGLRMIWSHKYQNGVYYEPYKPWKRLNTNGSIHDLPSEPCVEMLNIFTIRTNEQSTKDTYIESSDFLQNHINKHMKGYSTARIKRIGRTRDGYGFYIQSDSKYCEYIKRNHTSNHIWFLIQGGRICSICHDESCKGKKGQEYSVPPSLINELENRIPSFIDDCD
jgi:hypothetical protein